MKPSIQRTRHKIDLIWPELRLMFMSGESLHNLARVYKINRSTLRQRLQRAGLLERRQRKAGSGVPCRADPPYIFQCAYCKKEVFVDPATGDRRFRFCSRKCERGCWRHHDPNTGKRKDIK